MMFVKESSSVYSAGLAIDDVEFTDCAVGDGVDHCDDETGWFHCEFSKVCVPRYKVRTGVAMCSQATLLWSLGLRSQ